MRALGYMSVSFMSVLLFLGCRGKNHSVPEEYSYVEDCLNGYYIVSSGSGEGVVDAAGDAVVPASCERLYFIENDVIAGFAGGMWRFFSTAGDVIAEVSGGADEAPEMLLEKYCDARRAQDTVWEGIVSGYEGFCRKCASEDADFGDMRMVADSLREKVSHAEGRMSEGQRRRIEQAYSQYREMRDL